MRERALSTVTIMLALACVALALRFVFTFNENLHCTQDTSFKLAALDMEPHVEEAIEGGPPFVYRSPFAVPLRIYLTTTLLIFLFAPPILAILVATRVLGYRMWLRIVALSAGILLLNGVTPNIIVGERFSALAWIGLVGAIPPLLLLTIMLRAFARVEKPAVAGG